MITVVSLSGGKDSVALWLWARRVGLAPRAIYADTQWEWNEGHYAYLTLVAELVEPFTHVRAAETFAELTRRKKTFPSRVRKWCTEELKLIPFRAELDRLRDETGQEVRVLIGIRREESEKRRDPKLHPEREWSDFYDCEVVRPILDWTIADVAREHHLAGVPMHPLYHLGAERVGCWPCVNAGKTELRLVGEQSPERVAEIRALELEIGSTMFTRDRRTEKRKLIAQGVPEEEAGPSVVPIPIDDVIRWASTKRGGEQLTLFQPPTGCARWGVCEAPQQPDGQRGGRE